MEKTCTDCNISKGLDEFYKHPHAKYGRQNRCKVCSKRRNKRFMKNNPEYYSKYQYEKYHNDEHYKLARLLRTRVRKAIQGNHKTKPTLELLGCSLENLKEHLEKQFNDGMSWNNFGEWHIDHIKPCASFDLTDPKQQKECFHYTNLQPLWAEDNLKKGTSYVTGTKYEDRKDKTISDHRDRRDRKEQ